LRKPAVRSVAVDRLPQLGQMNRCAMTWPSVDRTA
jgi:hypothetical protein